MPMHAQHHKAYQQPRWKSLSLWKSRMYTVRISSVTVVSATLRAVVRRTWHFKSRCRLIRQHQRCTVGTTAAHLMVSRLLTFPKNKKIASYIVYFFGQRNMVLLLYPGDCTEVVCASLLLWVFTAEGAGDLSKRGGSFLLLKSFVGW